MACDHLENCLLRPRLHQLHGVHDHLIRTVTQTISGRCDELGSLCFVAGKDRLWSRTSIGRGCDRYPSVDRTWFIANFSPADFESADFDQPFLS